MSHEEVFILDSSALISWWAQGSGEKLVDDMLRKSKDKKVEVNVLSTDIAGVYYHLLQEKGKAWGKTFMEEVEKLPLNIVAVNKKIAAEAADCMIEYGLENYTEALSCSLAIISGGKLVTTKNELKKVTEAELFLIS